MAGTDEVKEAFYEDLDRTIRKISWNDRLIILGEFNISVGCKSDMWRKVIGKYRI